LRIIDTVLFDLDDTLHDDSAAYKNAARRVTQEVAAAHGVDGTTIFDAYVVQASNFWKTLSTDALANRMIDTRFELWLEALRAVGLDRADVAVTCAAAYTEYRKHELELSPGSMELILALRERGVKLGIVTNGFAETHHEKIALLGLTPLFDALFIADEMGMVKPDPRVFALACRTLGSTPERTAMVGDRYDRDVSGALELGLFTVLVDVHRIPLIPSAPPPDAIVPTIADVLGVLPLAPAAGREVHEQNRSR
jgi:HAD superfamily hydrolase (TIGR01549 family)